MSDADDAAAVLEGFQAISSDDPRLQDFRDSVLERVAARPSPTPSSVAEEDRLSRVEAKLDEILVLLRGGPL